MDRRESEVAGSPKSYISSGENPFLNIIQNVRTMRALAEEAARQARIVELAQLHLKECFGVEWLHRRLLDVGCGQLLRKALIFGTSNSVTAIDIELPFRPPFIPDLIRCIRTSGFHRASKTLIRQILGVDRRFRKALSSHLKVDRLPNVDVYYMNAKDLEFADASFDGVFSFSVFQHIDEPSVAAAEIHRVLKPGAIAYIQLHLYTSASGSDCPQITLSPDRYPPWAHLRTSSQYYGKEGLYHNHWRLAQWKNLFEGLFEVVRYPILETEIEENRRILSTAIRAELADFNDEELLITTLTAVCRK